MFARPSRRVDSPATRDARSPVQIANGLEREAEPSAHRPAGFNGTASSLKVAASIGVVFGVVRGSNALRHARAVTSPRPARPAARR